jgi:hypothetical protein
MWDFIRRVNGKDSPFWPFNNQIVRVRALTPVTAQLQLRDRLGDRWCAFPVHNEAAPAPD